jgi:hypothetical protein
MAIPDRAGSSVAERSGRIRPALLIAVTAGIVAVALVVTLVLRFVGQERDRDITNWQVRLGIVADSRKAAIESWVAQQWNDLGAISDNDSVRLFLTELKRARSTPLPGFSRSPTRSSDC